LTADNSFAEPTIINLGSNFSNFWEKAKGREFSEQLALWNQLVENPQKQFYMSVVWRNTEAPDFLDRKSKRLKELFEGYGLRNVDIQRNFNQFDSTIQSQIKKFKNVFPAVRFSRPIMAVLAPTFNGKSDSYEVDGNTKHFLAFGIDTLTIRDDDPDVLYSHELFHLYHGEASEIEDDGASANAALIDSLWAEGLATYVSKELNPSAKMSSVFMDSALAGFPISRLSEIAQKFLKVRNEKVHSKDHPEVYGFWFLMNKQLDSRTPPRVGYWLGYHVAKELRQKYSLDEMAHWSFQIAHQKIVPVLEQLGRS
jgi:hypothetical protein